MGTIKRWSQELPRVTEVLPVLNQQKQVGVVFFLFGMEIDIYLEEMFYAYRQLVRHTNIEEVGGVHLFVEAREAHRVVDRIGVMGLSHCVTYIPIKGYRPLSGYLECFGHYLLKKYRYCLFMDTDMWFMSDGYPRINWFDILKVWDACEEMTLFAEPISKPDWKALRQFRIAAAAKTALSVNVRSTRCVGGWFVGMRQGQLVNLVVDLHGTVYSDLMDDEPFFECLLTAYPQIEVSNPLGKEVPWAYLGNFMDFESSFVMNVGVEDFMMDRYAEERVVLRDLL